MGTPNEDIISFDIVRLRHPRNGLGATFVFSTDNSIVHEIFSFSDKRSWFINDSVRRNGKIFFLTPVDPLFLILPYLIKYNKGNATPLEHLFEDDTFPEVFRLLSVSSNINFVADKKGRLGNQ